MHPLCKATYALTTVLDVCAWVTSLCKWFPLKGISILMEYAPGIWISPNTNRKNSDLWVILYFGLFTMRQCIWRLRCCRHYRLATSSSRALSMGKFSPRTFAPGQSVWREISVPRYFALRRKYAQRKRLLHAAVSASIASTSVQAEHLYPAQCPLQSIRCSFGYTLKIYGCFRTLSATMKDRSWWRRFRLKNRHFTFVRNAPLASPQIFTASYVHPLQSKVHFGVAQR